MPRNSPALIALLLAGCDGATVGNRTQQSGEVKVIGIDEDAGNGSETPLGEGAPPAWRVVNGAAFYGAANQPAIFALRCDPRAQLIVFERAGSGEMISLSAGGIGASLGTRAVGNGRVQARTGLTDAVLDAMARPRAQIAVGGGAEVLTVPGGVAVRRVVDFCRNPPAPEPAPVAPTGPVVIPPTIDEPGEGLPPAPPQPSN
jgi:hypothetical protein